MKKLTEAMRDNAREYLRLAEAILRMNKLLYRLQRYGRSCKRPLRGKEIKQIIYEKDF